MNIVLDYATIEAFWKKQGEIKYAGEIYGFDNDDLETVEKKIGYVWDKESLDAMRLSPIQKQKFAEHIKSLNISTPVIRGEKPDKEYFDIVEAIATRHGIKRSNSDNELYLLSAATKYCGHHNRKYPFYDKNNLGILKLMGYNHCDRNFVEFVNAFKDIQKKCKLDKLTLRKLDYYLWNESKIIVPVQSCACDKIIEL